MLVKNQYRCDVTLFKDDAISQVLVTDAYREIPNQYGVFVKDGIPTYVCTSLYLKGGTAVNVQIKDGGCVWAEEGVLRNVAVCRKGRLDVKAAAEATDVRECGGVVYCDAPWSIEHEPRTNCTFTPTNLWMSSVEGVMSLHKGTRFHDITINKNTLVDIFGGELEDCVCDEGTIQLGDGTIKNLDIKNGSLSVYGGHVENVTINSKCTLRLGDHTDALIGAEFVNVVVKEGASIIRYCNRHDDNTLEGPDLSLLTIENGVIIYNEYELEDESIQFEEAIYPNLPADHVTILGDN